MKLSRLRWLSAFAGAAVLVAIGALIGIYVSEGDSSKGEQVELLACREFERYKSDLSAEKLEALARRCEEAKAVAARGPVATAPILTPVPGTPGPVVPCDQWSPTSGGGCRFYGVLEGRQPPPGYEKIILVSNHWAGENILVYAGSVYDDSSQGMLVVTERERGVPLGEYRSKAAEGALRIVSAEGNLLNLTTDTGTEYTFDLDAMALAAK